MIFATRVEWCLFLPKLRLHFGNLRPVECVDAWRDQGHFPTRKVDGEGAHGAAGCGQGRNDAYLLGQKLL